MANKFSPNELAEFKQAFDEWNADGNAHLDQDEMQQAMKKLGVDTSKMTEMLKEVIINFLSFLTACDKL